MTEIIKQIEEISEKAVMYDNLKNRYLEAVKKLEEAQELIDEASKILDPVKTAVKHNEHKRTKYADKVEEQYNKLKMGLYISTDTMEKDYPDLRESQILAIYMILSKSPGVLVRQKPEGRGKELYILKNG